MLAILAFGCIASADAEGTTEVKKKVIEILKGYRGAIAATDVNPHIIDERYDRIRVLENQYRELGTEGEKALLTIYSNPTDPSPEIQNLSDTGSIRTLTMTLYSNSDIDPDGPMFAKLREDLSKFVDSGFDSQYNIMISSIVHLMIKKGDESDLELVRRLRDCPGPEYRTFSRWAVKEFEKRLKNDRLDAARAGSGPQGNAQRTRRAPGGNTPSEETPGSAAARRPALLAAARRPALLAAAVLALLAAVFVLLKMRRKPH